MAYLLNGNCLSVSYRRLIHSGVIHQVFRSQCAEYQDTSPAGSLGKLALDEPFIGAVKYSNMQQWRHRP